MRPPTVVVINEHMSALQMPCVHDQDWINALAPLRDRRVASASDDNTIVISNPLKGSLDARLEGHGAAGQCPGCVAGWPPRFRIAGQNDPVLGRAHELRSEAVIGNKAAVLQLLSLDAILARDGFS